MKRIGDIDIDVKPNFDKSVFGWTRASIYDSENLELRAHPVGVHPQSIPIDAITGLSAIPYNLADDEFGYCKIDFLTLSIYEKVKDREELDYFVNNDPDWSLLLNPELQLKLFQLHKHGALLDELKPTCLMDVAEILALVRPGKERLIPLYKKNRNMMSDVLWEDTGGGYQFKKSHAICYALVVQVQLHLFANGRI